jgi:hypothetical protein
MLDQIGLGPMADLIREELQEPISEGTVRHAVREWRNKGIAHQTFNPEHLLKAMEPLGLENPKHAELLRNHFEFLVRIARDLRGLVRSHYPQAARYLDTPLEALAEAKRSTSNDGSTPTGPPSAASGR